MNRFRHLVGLERLAPEPSVPKIVRRPGERREPLRIEVRSRSFVEGVGACGISVPGAIELALEFELVRRDLSRLGKEGEACQLFECAEVERVSAALAPPMANYLRTLSNPRPRRIDPLELEQPIDVALRLFPRVLEIDGAKALTSERLVQALTLERAAVGSGRTMSEYALLFAAGVQSVPVSAANSGGRVSSIAS